MEDSPGLAMFAGTMCSVGFVMVTTFISMMAFQEISPIKYTIVTSAVVAFSYVCYMFFSMQFKNFLDERKELFDIIKDR
jgi:multisubunit Na+/H+ antiporter MnhB subunit